MTGIILDCILMLLLVAALGYGVRLEKKLTALRSGQLAFAGAVTELNQAAGRAENALVSLRQSGEEADILHDRLMKAREVKQQLEMLIARAPVSAGVIAPLEPGREISAQAATPAPRAPTPAPPVFAGMKEATAAATTSMSAQDDRALRMAALAERIHGITRPAAAAPGRDNVAAILGAMTANQAAKQSLNQARRSLDEDLFAA
jgi:hypothetical protein